MTSVTAHTEWIFDIMANRKKKGGKFDSTFFAFFCQIKIRIDSYAMAFALAETFCEEIHRIEYKDTDDYEYNVHPVASKFWNMRVGQI